MKNKEIRRKLLQALKLDQEVRIKGLSYFDVDKNNQNLLKSIIKQIGWPTIPKVGKQVSIAAWAIAQHSDRDKKFQKRCLKLMKENINAIDTRYLPYIIDRILVNEGKYQLYGTQFYTNKKGVFKERPIKQKKELAKRRKEYKLESFTQYKQKMTKLIKK